MSEELIIHYRGFEIKWNGNREEWYCYDIDGKDGSSPKPSKIKAAIDKMYLSRRKASSVAVLEIAYGGGFTRGTLIDAMVTEYVGPIVERDYSTPNGRKIVGHKVAVVAERKDNRKASRRELRLDTLASDTPEVRAAYDEYIRLFEESRRVAKLAEAAQKAIPRLRLEDINPLVELYEKMKEEGAV